MERYASCLLQPSLDALRDALYISHLNSLSVPVQDVSYTDTLCMCVVSIHIHVQIVE